MTISRNLILVSCLAVLWSGPAQAAYDLPYVGEMEDYRARYEDTFVHVARDYNLGYVEIRAANPEVDPWIPGEGKKLIMPMMHILPDAPREGVVINLADMRLYAFTNGDEAPTHFPIGIGREGLSTPLGKTTVVRKVHGPVWTPTPRMRKEKPELPPFIGSLDPTNPMGTHALYLGFPLIAIHGTDKPFGIGRRVSSGCIRLYPENIIKLYDMLPVGTQVTVVNQPVKLAWIENKLYLEAHPNLDQAIQIEETGQLTSESMTDDEMRQILKVAGEYQDRLHWSAIRNAIRERSGYPIVIARRPSSDETVEELPDEQVEQIVQSIYADEESAEGVPDYSGEGKNRTLNP